MTCLWSIASRRWICSGHASFSNTLTAARRLPTARDHPSSAAAAQLPGDWDRIPKVKGQPISFPCLAEEVYHTLAVALEIADLDDLSRAEQRLALQPTAVGALSFVRGDDKEVAS